MMEYIKNLLPRLKQFSNSLSHLENFVDKAWIYIDEKENRHTYIFQRNKSLIMSLNGKVLMGSWEYIAAAESLLIDRGTDKVLLKHGFLDKAIMVLRTDNNFDRPWMLIDEKLIPDLNVEKYLKDLLINREQLIRINYPGKFYYYSDIEGLGLNPQSKVYDENLDKANITFVINGKTSVVENGAIKEEYYKLNYNTDKGVVNTISKYERLIVSDYVLMNGGYAADGYYTLIKDANYKGFSVAGGKVSAINEKSSLPSILAILSILIVVIIIVIYSDNKNKNKISTTFTDSTSIFIDSSANTSVDKIDTAPRTIKNHVSTDSSSPKTNDSLPDTNQSQALTQSSANNVSPTPTGSNNTWSSASIDTGISFSQKFIVLAKSYIGKDKSLIIATEGDADSTFNSDDGWGMFYINKNAKKIAPKAVSYVFLVNENECHGISMYFAFNQLDDVINFMNNNFQPKDPPPGINVNFFKAWVQNDNVNEVYLWKLFKTDRLFFLTIRLIK
ncbi:MAG: hypothetical protein ABI091_05690 [Ferruginibacter sp.]